MNVENMKCKAGLAAILTLCTGLAACGDDEGAGSGSLVVLLESEDTITDGLQPGDGTEDIRDGWAVEFDKYVMVIGDIDVILSSDESVGAEAGDVFAVDLSVVPPSGLTLWTLEGLTEGRWEFNYAALGAADGATRHESVAQADFDEMLANDWTYLIDGVLTKSDGQSCPPAALVQAGERTPNGNTSGGNDCYDAPTIRFVFGAAAETSFGPCEVDEIPGFSITADATQTVAATIHGDHLFFNGFPEGDEGGVTRLAQWMADCDLNLDGTVTAEELAAIAPAQLPELDDRFQLGGSPVTPLDNMYIYLSAQLKTQGHFQGEGECPIDGVAHQD
jgi:hypothetical protein